MCKFSNLLVVFCVICGLPQQLKANGFDYEHQAKWYDEYQQCGLNRQSPIELNSNEAEITYDIPPLNFAFYDTPYLLPATSENNGHTANVQLPKPKAYVADLWRMYDLILPQITGGPLGNGRYIADSVHFHWGSQDAHGSEHVIDSERFSMEMHLLHRNSKYQTVEEAREHEDGLTVLAVLYTTKLPMQTDFAGLSNIIDSLERIVDFNKTAEIEHLTLSALLGDMERAEFYTYDGSLTTPPCSEVVTWVVFSHPIHISHEQMQRFHKLSDGHGAVLENNYRALQAKGNRKVYLRNKRNTTNAVTESPPQNAPLPHKFLAKIEGVIEFE